jgi:hypothetical protein
MKEWHCILVDHHEKIGTVIEKFSNEGWCLLTYTTAGPSSTFMGYAVNHYLLFEREKS